MSLKRVPVTPEQVSGVHSDMPLYVKPSVMDGWEALSLAEAESSRWYEDEDLIVEIPREVVDSDELHFKGNSVDEDYVAFVDIDGIRADYAVTDTYGRNAVWNTKSRLAVWHDAGSTDSTGNGHDGTGSGGVTLGGATGKLGAATLYDGVDDYSDVGTLGSFGSSIGNSNGWSISVWLKGSFEANVSLMATIPESGSNMLFQINTATTDIGSGEKDYIFLATRADDNDNLTRHYLDTAGLFDNNWNKLQIVAYPPGTATTESVDDVDFFINNSQVTTEIVSPPRSWADASAYNDFSLFTPIAARQNRGTIDRHMNITMEEMQIALSNDFSDSYITTEYNNQNDVASFWGTVTDAGGDPPAVADTGFFAFM